MYINYEKSFKAMHLLHKRIQNLNLPLDLQLKLFDSTILPIITYGCEIWGYENLEIFERIHTKFLRSITKCRKSTPLYMLYGELGRYPLKMTIKTRIIGFWTRTITGFGWLVGCFGLNCPLRQYFSLYRAVSQREGERKEN